MRIFLAVELPENVKNKIVELEDRLKQYSKFIRLIRADNLHFTVKFLGEQNDFAIRSITETVKKIVLNKQSFEININKSGIFGGLRNPRILWIGEDNDNFTTLSKEINEALDAFRHENKPPVCHLTIGRIKGISVKDITEAMSLCRQFLDKNNLRFGVGSVYLYKSRLLKSGAVYEKIEKFSMKGRVRDG